MLGDVPGVWAGGAPKVMVVPWFGGSTETSGVGATTRVVRVTNGVLSFGCCRIGFDVVWGEEEVKGVEEEEGRA